MACGLEPIQKYKTPFYLLVTGTMCKQGVDVGGGGGGGGFNGGGF